MFGWCEQRLRDIALAVKLRGHGYETQLLNAVLQQRLDASVSNFNAFDLVDFREKLLLPVPVQVSQRCLGLHAYSTVLDQWYGIACSHVLSSVVQVVTRKLTAMDAFMLLYYMYRYTRWAGSRRCCATQGA